MGRTPSIGRGHLLPHNATQARKLARIHMEHSEQTLLQGMEESPEFTKA